MDAVIKKILFSIIMATLYSWLPAQQMQWNRLAEDTIYYGRDYLPTPQMVTMTGPVQTWDFRSLKAPYAISRRIVVSGERADGKLYANLVNGKQTDAILQLTGNASQIIQVIQTNPLCSEGKLTFSLTPSYTPFFNGVLGEQKVYRGKMVSTFVWPRHITCSWAPVQIPDSCRITYTVMEETTVQAEGTLYLPTEVAQVYRQSVELKKALKIEVLYANSWKDVTLQVPGVRLISQAHYLRFVSALTGIPMVEIELDDNDMPFRVEFKTHPMITRVFAEEPSKPDIFAYPNPSYDIVRFQLSDLNSGKYHLKLFNILGVPVKETEVKVDDSREAIALDLSDMQRGTYLFRLQDDAGRTIKTKRVVLIRS